MHRGRRYGILINAEPAGEWWKGALWAVVSLTHPAADTDRLNRVGIIQIETGGVNQSVGMANLAAEANGEFTLGLKVAVATLKYRTRQAEIGFSIRHLRQLGKDGIGVGERLMDIP